MLLRPRHLAAVSELFERYLGVTVLGARQIGKTTLARALVANYDGPSAFFDLEDPGDDARLADPMLALKDLAGMVVLDEIQLRPDIFPVLRVLLDRPGTDTRFLLLGSASPELIQRSTESLAGRIALYELPGLMLDEVGDDQLKPLWLRGGFPRSFIAGSDRASTEWRRNFVRTFLERDLPQLGVTISAQTMRRFWTMLAHLHGQVWNASALGRSFGVSDTTVRRYLDTLSSTFVVRQLLPWHENIGKRQVKSPKIFLNDSGLLHTLLGLPDLESLESHPKVGASWEGFVLGEVIARLGATHEECFFWATHAGAELDLLVTRGNKRLGFEVKRTLAPKLTRSMRTALTDLNLDHIYVIYPGEQTFSLADSAEAVPCSAIWTDLPRL